MADPSGYVSRHAPGDTSSNTWSYIVTRTEEKTRETRLRRMAERQGLTIRKSRRRDPRAIDYGRWWVVHPDERVVELADIDTVERYLEGER